MSCKIDLYHATAHFEVRKFVHNAKSEELKYDRMIDVAKAHERACQEYQIHKQAHSMAPPVTTLILCYKQVLYQNLFRKVLPRSPVANVDAHTIMVNTLPTGLYAVSVARRTTGLSNVEALGGGIVHLDAHPSWEGHRNRDNKESVASSSTKAGDEEEEAMATSRDHSKETRHWMGTWRQAK